MRDGSFGDGGTTDRDAGFAGGIAVRESLTARNRELFEPQRRARRGPTPEVFFTKHIDNSRMVKADDPERRREMRTFTAVMSVLLCW